MCHISWLACVCSVSILNIIRTKIDLLNTSAKTAFVTCFLLAFESTSFKRKQWHSVSGFYQSLLRPIKNYVVLIFRISKQNLFSFHDFYNFSKIKHSKVRPGFKTMFTCHFNQLECFMLFPNDNIHLNYVKVV